MMDDEKERKGKKRKRKERKGKKEKEKEKKGKGNRGYNPQLGYIVVVVLFFCFVFFVCFWFRFSGEIIIIKLIVNLTVNLTVISSKSQ